MAHEIPNCNLRRPSDCNFDDDPPNRGWICVSPLCSAASLADCLPVIFGRAESFLGVSVLTTLLSLVLWLLCTALRASPLPWLTIAIFALGSLPALQALKLQNLSVIAAALIASRCFCVCRPLVLGGILLAVSTFKPQFTIALFPGLLSGP